MTAYLLTVIFVWIVYSAVLFACKYFLTVIMHENHNTMIYLNGKFIADGNYNIEELEGNVSEGVKALELYFNMQEKDKIDSLKPKRRKLNKNKATRNLEAFIDHDVSFTVEDHMKNVEKLVKKINKENKDDIKISASYRPDLEKRTKTL